VIVAKRDPVTGRTNTLDLPVTQVQLDLWQQGALIQDVFPDLTDDQREFLISGLLPESWDALFPEEDE
jgi:hypothetical protein